ncbi:RHS repeat-associated core domain-containing protein [Pseudomonas sp. NPDC089547]|uniref:RHS repeat-associated core domain-containing protein n=1 Tax=Pseudomonas sp. NPDC089547 TaxID=3390652 RepID=UPI003D0589BA
MHNRTEFARRMTYCSYGYSHNNQRCIISFKGEHPNSIDGSYFFGNGYRRYNPVLKRFERADTESPFGVGGINAYAFVLGDPINLSDPSGRGPGLPISPPLAFKGKIQLIKGLRVFTVASDKVPAGAIITIVAHGNGAGQLGKKYGPYHAAKKVYQAMKNNNIPVDSYPTHLVSCRGADTSIFNKTPAAQEWANLTGQPAISYKGVVVAARTKIPRRTKNSFDGFVNIFTHENFKPVTFYPDATATTDARSSIRRH